MNTSNAKVIASIEHHDSKIDPTEDSCNWLQADWEIYLRSLETTQKECQLTNAFLPYVLAQSVFKTFSNSCSEELSSQVENLIQTLSERQQLVIKKIFWEGLSERQTARMMGISRQGVFDLKKRAIRNLKRRAPKVLANFPLVESKAEPGADVISLETFNSKKEVNR